MDPLYLHVSSSGSAIIYLLKLIVSLPILNGFTCYIEFVMNNLKILTNNIMKYTIELSMPLT